MSWGMDEMMGPYRGMLSYSSYSGTATSRMLRGTCAVQGRGTPSTEGCWCRAILREDMRTHPQAA